MFENKENNIQKVKLMSKASSLLYIHTLTNVEEQPIGYSILLENYHNEISSMTYLIDIICTV